MKLGSEEHLRSVQRTLRQVRADLERERKKSRRLASLIEEDADVEDVLQDLRKIVADGNLSADDKVERIAKRLEAEAFAAGGHPGTDTSEGCLAALHGQPVGRAAAPPKGGPSPEDVMEALTGHPAHNDFHSGRRAI